MPTKTPTKAKTRPKIDLDLARLRVVHHKLQRATDIAESMRPERDLLIRKLVNKGSGIRELATKIDAYPSTITRVCQQYPPVNPHRKGWPGGKGS